MEVLGWILVGVVLIAIFIGLMLLVLLKKSSFEIKEVDFKFLKSANWVKNLFAKKILREYLDEQFMKLEWKWDVFKDFEVVFTGKFPIQDPVDKDKLVTGYYMSSVRMALIGVCEDDLISQTGHKYIRMEHPRDTALVHEMKHHWLFKTIGDEDSGHTHKIWSK